MHIQMPGRAYISKELADLFGVLAHPDRIRIIEELRSGELDVNHVQQAIGLPQSRVSQHLAILRAHRVVAERREARHVYYRLSDPALAHWILSGAEFLRGSIGAGDEFRTALDQVYEIWGDRK
jgi:DNA-binding transcriptional ArsR family regulator